MTFASPLAWFGLVAVAVPVAVHLLARHRGPRTAFPTLRFFQVDRLVSLTRYQLTDLLLLAVRIAVVVLTVAALAGPQLHFGTPSIGRVQPAIAILVDTSASLSRPGIDGKPAVDAARAEAVRLKSSSDRATVIETDDLRGALGGANAWLDAQTGPREVAIISDFQRGALSSADVAGVPSAVGIRVVPIAVTSPASVSAPSVWRNDAGGKLREHTPRLALTPDETSVTWITSADSVDQSRTFDLDPMLAFVASPADTPRALAALRAVMGQGSRAGSRERPVAMVFAGAPGFGTLWDQAASLDRPWMSDVVRELQRDISLTQAAAHARVTARVNLRDGLVPVVSDAGGQPLIIASSASSAASAAIGDAGSTHRLLLFVEGDPASLPSALVMETVMRATSPDPFMGELEPVTVDAAVLHSWERPPHDAPADRQGPADPIGRWIWAIVLIALAAETWMRREARDTPAGARQEVTHDRVA